MSNLIKSNFIFQKNGEKRIIDSDGRKDFRPITAQNLEQIIPNDNSVNIDEIMEPFDHDEKMEEILSEAKEKAKNIIADAEKEAVNLKESIFEEARSLGFQEGMKESEARKHQIEQEFSEKEKQLQLEYDAQIESIEPAFVDILISLIKKITGILIEDKKEVILFLVNQAIKNLGRCSYYKIKVSKEDYKLLEANQNNLYEAVHNEAKIDIVEEDTFVKNQCIIETDSKMIDCSIDVQVKNLTETLKLLSLC